MRDTTTTLHPTLAALNQKAALGQAILDLVKQSGLAKPRKRRARTAKPGRKRAPRKPRSNGLDRTPLRARTPRPERDTRERDRDVRPEREVRGSTDLDR